MYYVFDNIATSVKKKIKKTPLGLMGFGRRAAYARLAYTYP